MSRTSPHFSKILVTSSPTFPHFSRTKRLRGFGEGGRGGRGGRGEQLGGKGKHRGDAGNCELEFVFAGRVVFFLFYF